jgi:hypothetical protein
VQEIGPRVEKFGSVQGPMGGKARILRDRSIEYWAGRVYSLSWTAFPLTLTMFVCCIVKRVLSWFDLLVHHEHEPWNAASNQKISAEFVDTLLNQAWQDSRFRLRGVPSADLLQLSWRLFSLQNFKTLSTPTFLAMLTLSLNLPKIPRNDSSWGNDIRISGPRVSRGVFST